MNVVVDTLRRLGGMATTSELRSQGIDRFQLDIALMYDCVVRVRKGLWTLPETEPEIVSARRCGGRVACVSALAFHGLLEATAEDGLHIEVPHNASRLRHVEDRRRRIVVHWTRHPVGADRFVVPVAEAMRQFERCAAASAPNR